MVIVDKQKQEGRADELEIFDKQTKEGRIGDWLIRAYFYSYPMINMEIDRAEQEKRADKEFVYF